MKNIKLVIEYDGTNYNGWQKQKNGVTIQQTIEKAIEKLTGEEVKLEGSSRTDSGVHAKAYVANFKTNATIPPHCYSDALKSRLPADIVIISSEEMSEDFHSRYCSTGKTYCYTILNRELPSALKRNYTYHVRKKLDIKAMEEACGYFIGTHDFKAFRSLGSSTTSTVRTITDLHIEVNNEEINIFVSADGFLYNMVRIIVGTLIFVGTGKIKPIEIKEIINLGERNKAGRCVPPMGLTLEKVFY